MQSSTSLCKTPDKGLGVLLKLFGTFISICSLICWYKKTLKTDNDLSDLSFGLITLCSSETNSIEFFTSMAGSGGAVAVGNCGIDFFNFHHCQV
jgi:hypothetical protein